MRRVSKKAQPSTGLGSKEIAAPPAARGKGERQAVWRSVCLERFGEEHQSNNLMGAINFRLIAGVQLEFTTAKN